MSIVTTVEQLQAIYGEAGETSLVKEVDVITPHYRAFIEAAPFLALATAGPEGLDCSPRGDRPGFVRIVDERTLILPDRRGNNRIDSLRNVVRDPRVSLMFLIPGSGTVLRVNGQARISVDPALLESFTVKEKAPRSVMVIAVERVYFQCSRAILRSDLWNPDIRVDPASLPSPGAILAGLSAERVGGPAYDAAWPERAKASLW